MTKYEAIDYLLDPIGKREKHDEAIRMAIEALKRDIIDTNVGDTIYRHAAIDTINALHEEPNAWLDSAVDAVMTLPSAQSEQRWIPCSERLPGNSERVLVTTKNGEVLFGIYLGKYWAFGSKVLAWMPLPEPYQEIIALPSAQPKRTQEHTGTHACDLIDREAAVDAIYHHLPSVSRTRARTMLHEVPSAQPECKKGKWILPNNPIAVSLNEWICSECKYLIDGKHNFCPNCGADMREGQE